jgi:hypothetical protein
MDVEEILSELMDIEDEQDKDIRYCLFCGSYEHFRSTCPMYLRSLNYGRA